MNPRTWGRGVRVRIDTVDVPRAVMFLIWQRDGGLGCVECKRLSLTPPLHEPLELDHKQPLSKGGDNHYSNLQILCRSHNRGRRERPIQSMGKPAWLRRQELEEKVRKQHGETP